MRKNIITGAAAAAVALLLAAPGVALADDTTETPVDSAPVVEVVEEAPAPVEETPVVEEVQTPIVEAPAPVVDETTPIAPPVVENEPVTPEPTPQTKTLRWALPDGGTPENVTWDQPVFDAALIPCGETVWIQVDTYPYTTPEDQARTDALDDDGILTYGEDHGWAQSWSFEKYDAPSCPPIVAPTPTAQLAALCGEAQVTLTNPQQEGTIGQTASFIVEVDGAFHGAYAVTADGMETFPITFDEDSGDHTVEVFQSGISEWASLGAVVAPSNCIIPEEPETPIEEQETPAVVTPVVETPALQAALRTTPLEADTLAQTGADQNLLIAGAGAAGVLATLGALLFALSRRPFAVKGRETLER